MQGSRSASEDLNDHDQLRHDPLMAILAGQRIWGREDCAPIAGKSTLNRLKLSKLAPTRYHKVSHTPVAIRALLADLFLGGAPATSTTDHSRSRCQG